MTLEEYIEMCLKNLKTDDLFVQEPLWLEAPCYHSKQKTHEEKKKDKRRVIIIDI